MHHKKIELNFDASCQQILGLESEILWEARSTPTLVTTLLFLILLLCSSLNIDFPARGLGALRFSDTFLKK
jgi:hypothetical protein